MLANGYVLEENAAEKAKELDGKFNQSALPLQLNLISLLRLRFVQSNREEQFVGKL